MKQAILPPKISKGDTIGLIAPASSLVNRDNFTAGIEILEKKGFKVKFNPEYLKTRGYLAGTDKERADTFNRFWADHDVKAIVASRGGYGCLRLIDLIDMKLIRKNPKILIGFSDITVLLNTIYKKTGLITYHGPVVTTLADLDRPSLKSFFNTLTDNKMKPMQPSKIKVLHKGKATGTLQGGNLTTLVHMIGTPYEPSWKDTILFLEDIDEPPYKLDRLLTHLYQAKRLQKIKGLILGTFTDVERREKSLLQRTAQKRIIELFKNETIPVMANFPSGHSRRNLTLPIGSKVKLETSSGTLTVLSS